MNRRDWREIFEIINDPGTPILFLIGIMIFAILGNGLYDLLVVTIQRNFDDEGNFTYVIIIATASLLLLAIIFVLWLWFNLRWKRRNRFPNNIKLEQTYPILIIFVSANPKASELIAIQHHLADDKLQKLWLIASPESENRAKSLSDWVKQRTNQPIHVSILLLESAYDIPQAYRTIVFIFELIADQIDQAIVDITSGTKQMSAGAVLACREYGVPMQYVLGELKGGKVDENSAGELIKVQV
ncbi:MAG: hypothetical protein J7467_12655 [Chloroflexus sp.]|nr:hypothetical protein [Chloroflexus sp.]